MTAVERIALSAITGGTQVRTGTNAQTVQEYAEALQTDKGWATWPPIIVYRDRDSMNWLADGFHRVEAARLAGLTELPADIRSGTRWDAFRFALGANGAHGLRRTHADIANAIRLAYENRKALGLPDVPAANLIAQLVGTNHHTVEDQLGRIPSWSAATHRTGADGRTRPVPPVPAPRQPPPPPPPVAPGPPPGDDEDGEESGPPPPAGPPPPRAPAPAKAPAAGAPPAPAEASPATSDGEAPAADAVVDCVGRVIPPHLHALWARRKEVKDMLRTLSQMRCTLERASEQKDPLYVHAMPLPLASDLRLAYGKLKAALPYALCAMCHGAPGVMEGCRVCRTTGLISQFVWHGAIPRRQREIILAQAGQAARHEEEDEQA